MVEQIGAMEDFKQVQQGTPEEVQKGLHGHHDPQHLPELERVVVTFQSCKACTNYVIWYIDKIKLI